MNITEQHIQRIKEIVYCGLISGLGEPKAGQTCIEGAITIALGLPFNDTPNCVGLEVRKAKIAINDCNWPSPQDRAKGMIKLAIAQLGSNQIDQKEFKKRLKFNSTKILLPFLIQKHLENVKDNELLLFKEKFEKLEQLDNNLYKKFYNNYKYYYYNNYYYYYYYNYYYYYYYYYYSSKLDWLNLVASTILKTLQDLDSPGCKWLHLV